MTEPIVIIPDNVIYFPSLVSYDETVLLWNEVMSTNDLAYIPITIYGRTCIQSRMTSYYGAKDFKYSGQTMNAKPIPSLITSLMERCNIMLHSIFKNPFDTFNSCLVNYYPDGKSNIGHHSDGKTYRMGPNNAVLTVSLGGTRTFQFKSKSNDQTLDLQLNNGDVVLMYNKTQDLFTHSIIKDKSLIPRVSLTFREL